MSFRGGATAVTGRHRVREARAYGRATQMRRRIGFVVGASVVIGLVSPMGPAAATEATPDAIDALSVVPGLADAANSDSPAELIDSALGVSVEGASGASTTIERLGAESVDATYSEHGQTVVEGTSVDTDTVVQQLTDGARVLEVIGSAEAPQSFSYALDIPAGTTLLQQEDGSILIGTATTAGNTVSFDVDGVIGAPWATDAAGVPVPASYEVGADNVLTMLVEHTEDVAYPVVADPTVTGGGFRVVYNVFTPWAVTVYLNKARTSDAEDLGAGLCIAIAFVPVVGPVVAALCGLHNIVIRATSRYGYCQYWVANTITRSFQVLLYRGGFCT